MKRAQVGDERRRGGAVLSVELSTPITPEFEALVFKASRGIEDIYELRSAGAARSAAAPRALRVERPRTSGRDPHTRLPVHNGPYRAFVILSASDAGGPAGTVPTGGIPADGSGINMNVWERTTFESDEFRILPPQ